MRRYYRRGRRMRAGSDSRERMLDVLATEDDRVLSFT